MSRLQIFCLGDFRVDLDGVTISGFDTEKTRALLAYLAVESGKPIRRSFLAGLLWSDETEERSLHNLRQTISYLRKALGGNYSIPEIILADRETIYLNPEADIWIDTKKFVEYLGYAYKSFQCQKGNGLLNIRWLKKAAEVFKGQLLENFFLSKSALFEEWASITRENFNLQAIRAFEQIAEYHESRGEYQLGLQANLRIVDIFPWDEAARVRIIRLLAIEKQWSAAQRHFIALQSFLKEQLGVLPSEEVLQLMEQIRTAAVGKNSISPRIPLAKYYLPESNSAFIGRDPILDEIMTMIVCPEYRLITIMGPGGVGKSRLALEIANQLIGIYSDGVFFVSLINANNASQMIQLIAEATGLVVIEKINLKNQLMDYLRSKEILLVLDNFEHLLTCPECTIMLDEIIQQSPRTSIMVTSRERLSLQQECVYPLPGLRYPMDGRVALEQANSFEALTLFCKRALQIQRTFSLNENNFQSIIKICQVLEGLPLGIELAASAVLENGHEVIAKKIVKDLSVLNSNTINTHPRHQSLLAAFEVSWGLLTREEKKILSRLSVFRGGFERDAAQEICGATPGVLAALNAKSLIHCGETNRFYLHEAIRQFSYDKLSEDNQLSDFRTKHAQYYAEFLSGQSKALSGPNQSEALQKIQLEFGNAGLAWNWMVENKFIPEMKKCVDSLYHFFFVRSQFAEGMQWFQQAAQNIEDEPDNGLIVGMLLSRLGSLAYTIRENEIAFQSLNRSISLLDQINAHKELAQCQLYLGWYYQREKDFSKASYFADQCLEYYKKTEDDLGISQALSLIGSIWNRQGNNTEAKNMFEMALVSCRNSGNPRQMVIVLNRLADLACYEGDYQIAINLFTECLEISENLDDRYNQAIMLNNLGTICHLQNNFIDAKNNYLKSLTICEDIGDKDGVALALSNLGELATVQGDYHSALNYSERALQIAERLHEQWTVIVCYNSIGEIYCAMNRFDRSKEYFQKAIRMALEINGMDLVARVSVNYSRLLQMTGDVTNAIDLLQAALAHSSTEQDGREKAMEWLKEMHANFEVKNDDHLLEKAVKKVI